MHRNGVYYAIRRLLKLNGNIKSCFAYWNVINVSLKTKTKTNNFPKESWINEVQDLSSSKISFVTSLLKHSWKNPYVVAMFERKTKCVLLNKILSILFLPFYQDPLELTPTLYCKRYKNLANLQFLRREELPNCLHLAHFPDQKNTIFKISV